LAVALAAAMVFLSFAALFLTKPQIETLSNMPINISCVGDSITQWSGYPDDLQMMLGEDFKVGNFGVAESAVSTEWFKPYVNQPAFQDSKAFAPDIVVIMLGTNDAHTYQSEQNFATDYENLVSEYLSLPSRPRVILVKPPPIYNNTLELSGSNLDDNVIPAIDQVAQDLNLTTVDVNNALINHPELFQDGVHPTSDGAMVIAAQIDDAINLYDTSYEQVPDLSS
jgi:lysophospholipase L1-like esterase